MAYVERYDSRKPPISLHPLFPAVVALWFAALFGLGSLVLPNLLIERAIVLTGIDSLVPMAAPPLGVTARIALALAMATGGAVLGFSVARRVAQAQANSRPARTSRRSQRSDYFEEPRARRPISARDELGATRLETPPAPDPGIGARRRALAMQEDDRPSAYLQAAPLPGAAHDYAPPPPHSQPASHPTGQAEPLDLARFEAPPQPQYRAEEGYGDQIAALRNTAPSGQDRPETVAPAVEWAQPPQPDFSQPDFSRPAPVQDFTPPPPVAHHFTPPAASPVAQAAHHFAAPAASPVAQAAQDFARPAPMPAPAQQFAPPEPLPVADFSRPAAPQPAPLPFSRPASPAPVGNDPMAPFRAPEPVAEPDEAEDDEYFPFGAAAFRPAPAPEPQAAAVEPETPPFAAPSQVTEPEDEPLQFFAPSQVAEAAAAPESTRESAEQPAEPQQPAAAAEPREPLDGLSMVDLAERLAKSLGKREGAIAPPTGLAAALGLGIAPRAAASVEAEPEPIAEPEPMAELEPETEEEDETAELPPAFAVPPAPPAPVIPEALRPIPLDLEEFGEDEDDLDLSLSFGRKILAEKTPPPGAQVFIADPLDAEDELDDGEIEDEDGGLSEIAGYSSLLGMKSPFRGPAEFIRIEQPEPADDPAEPAVVFPGQKASAPVAPAPAPQAPAEAQIRPFDAPGNVAAIEAPAATRPRVDRDEADRALRSALATLQRMSGAA